MFRRQLEIDTDRRFQIFARQTRRRVFIQTATKLIDPPRSNRDSSRMRMTTKLLKQIRTRSQPVQQVICLDTSSRAVGHIAVDGQHDARSINALSNLRRGDSNHTSMPALSRDYSDVRILSLV